MKAMLAGAGQAATERSFATIVAPYSGVVSARHVQLGEMATPGKPLMTGLRSRDAARGRHRASGAGAGDPGRAARRASRCPSRGRWIEATSITVVPSADPRTHTTQVRLELPADVARHLSRASSRARIS